MMRVLLIASLLACAILARSQDTFASKVYPVLQAANCRGCHTQGGLAGSTRLRLPDANADTARIEEFGRALISLVDRSAPQQSLILRKPTNREKHTGGQLIKPNSTEEASLLAWVREVAAKSPEPARTPLRAEEAARPKLRRLTHSQYNNTVRDLLGRCKACTRDKSESSVDYGTPFDMAH